MNKKLTAGEIRIIECMAFQRAEHNVSSGRWSKDMAELFLELVHSSPETHTYLTEGL